MSDVIINQATLPDGNKWLKSHYFTRAAVSVVWVAAAFTVGRSMPVVGRVLLLVYPAWDATCNLVDAQRNVGLRRNPTQALNTVVSGITTVAVAIALGMSMNAVLGVFGQCRTHDVGKHWLSMLSFALAAHPR